MRRAHRTAKGVPFGRTFTLGLVLALGAAAPAFAAPPNDAPQGALGFETVIAENGTPQDRQAVAQIADATADPGVPRCFGAGSFAKTVWYRVESAATPRRVKVEASGSTTSAPDLAAFVQPPGATDTAPALTEPQACDGRSLAGEGSSVVDLHVPAGHQVLIQAGRAAGTEPILLALTTSALAQASPEGDHGRLAPDVGGAPTRVPLAGATLSDEDPAQPRCPAAGTVWRRVPAPAGTYLVTAAGADTLAAFATLSGDGALDCVNRTRGPAALRIAVGGTFWVRLGADSPAAAPASLTIQAVRPDGTITGPAVPNATCRDVTRPALAVVRGAGRLVRRERRLTGRATDRACGLKGTVRRVEVALQRRVGKRCRSVGTAVRAGKRRSCARLTWVRARGAAAWSLTYRRALPTGRYVLRVRARDAAGNQSRTTRASFTIRSTKR